ncbi:hypothetical protein NJC40_03740 [Pseudomonas sp. 21LCFQ02]|uniref:hypothetical protein n=1 Tax=Pseudomonas sp. 21LCFQ02 TaxID=2957505 RepID=UPI00209AB8C3|nr:hypothetical protein [Pseudomonas sp. 21LCFQ02]MCO8166891.1 hypothetical protein [Pseudomonas sp. 21LCFQ02]
MSEQKWKLVPVEPTEEMWEAAKKADCYHASMESYKELYGADVRRRHALMLAAAPVPPALGGEPEVLAAVEQAMWNCFRYGKSDYRGCTKEQVEETRNVVRAHVTRLQAEVSQLRQHKNDFMEAAEETRKALQAEVAKHFEDNAELGKECSRLNRRTAELEGLLREAHEELVCRSGPVAKRIEAALVEGKEYE